jgi:hypothetical protein
MIGSYNALDALFDFQRALDSRLESDWLRGATAGTGAFPPINVFQQGDNLVAIIEPFEHFEDASYWSLAAAAKDAGEADIEEIMKQELAMADWVWQQLPPLTHKYLHRADSGAQAKR